MKHFAKQLVRVGSLLAVGLLACDDEGATDTDAAVDPHAEHAGEHGDAGHVPADAEAANAADSGAADSGATDSGATDSGAETGATDSGEDTGATDSGEDASHEDEDDFKGCPEGIPPFKFGLSAVGDENVFAIKVVEAMPTKPERYINNWIVEITTADGEPVDDVTIDRARTFMPIHGHDGNVKSVVTAREEPGQFDVERLNFTMRGPWEVQFWLFSESLGEDFVEFDVCVAK